MAELLSLDRGITPSVAQMSVATTYVNRPSHASPFSIPQLLQRPRRAQYDELTAFHSEDYIQMLQHTTPEEAKQNPRAYLKYGIELDCPIFHGLFDFCRLYGGASISTRGWG